MCEMYTSWQKSHTWSLGSIELEYRQELGLAIPALGFIDREFIDQDGNRILVDLKTNKKMPETPQLFEYAVVRRLQGVKIDFVAYYNARKGVLTDLISPKDHTAAWLRNYYGNVID